MADDKKKNGTSDDEGGLGNLPPLSDFDSSDSGLPPLGSFSDSASKESSGGLPQLGDIRVETPVPSGGAIKPAPPGFEMEAEFETPTFETPGTGNKIQGFKSSFPGDDFNPETPEIGAGEPTLDTPMFDSAFGGGGGGGFTPVFQTPAPTQAMETPMFGEQKPSAAPPDFGGPGFDDGAFGQSAFDQPDNFGTPAPDFSADTGVPAAAAGGTATPPKPVKAKPAKSGGGVGVLALIAAIVIFTVVGLGAGVYFADKATFMNFAPIFKQLADKDAQLKAKDETIKRLTTTESQVGGGLSEAQIQELSKQKEALAADIKALTTQQQDAKTNFDKTQSDLEQVRADLEAKNEEFVKAQESFEELQNQTSILQARQMGLVAESDRLTGLVGSLDDAVARSRSTKESLQHSVDRLAVHIKEGIPLSPAKYARDARIAAVESLKQRVQDAKWVTPELLDEYTALYVKDLEISGCTEYFFAKIPVSDRYGTREMKWAECLMKGNWAVYYRSIDGKNIGSYENLSPKEAAPLYGFRETLPELVQKQIESEIVASRGEGFEEKLKALAEKQVVSEGNDSVYQKVFNSL